MKRRIVLALTCLAAATVAATATVEGGAEDRLRDAMNREFRKQPNAEVDRMSFDASQVAQGRNESASRRPISHDKAEPLQLPSAMPSLPSLQLRNLVFSHGHLQPPFNPALYKYTLRLDAPIDQIAVVPEVQSHGQAQIRDSPRVTIALKGEENMDPEPSAIALKRQIDLPDDGSDSYVSIRISSSVDSSYAIYRVLLTQAYPSPASLKVVEGFDDTGAAVLVEGSNHQMDSVYNVYVSPQASQVSMKIGCNTGSSLKVNGRGAVNGGEILFSRDKSRHTQLVEVTCAKDIKYPGVPTERKYGLLLVSDWRDTDLLPPRITVDGVGHDCKFEEDKQAYKCPNPRSDSRKIRLISRNEPSIKYILSSANGQTDIRVLDRQPTVPFTYGSSALALTAKAGQFSKVWPVVFAGSALPSMLQIFGWILAVLLAVLLFALAGVIGAANIFGLGVPLGATEIAATLTLMIQYLCFANFMRGSTVLNKMVAPLKWVTIFWTLPWKLGDSLQRRSLTAYPSERELDVSYGLRLWGDTELGDVTDIRNACGCIFWCLAGLTLFLLIHSAVYIKFKVIEKEYTFPHRIAWGNWESRVLHWMAFPSSAAAGVILASDISSVAWKCIAGAIVLFYISWIAVVFFQIRGAIADRHVCWIWNSSVREDGTLEDESGYWMDVEADQLLTQPVNRSLCRGLFPYRWTSTVADIIPVSLSPGLFTSTATELFPPTKFSRAHKEAAYPLAKNPQVVEVIRSRAPGGPCKGQRLVAGLFRTQWLDILLTFQGLTRFHSQIFCETRGFAVPLIVKTAQLSGPLASGKNAFFYDGARIPFIRIADFFYRLVIGVCVGVALASEGHRMDAAMFAIISAVSLAFASYVFSTRPYSRTIENWLVAGLLCTILLSASSFVFYALRQEDPSWIADIFLWVVALCCFILAAYSCLITFSVFSALFCPPLEETRFLEKLANCNVTISDEQAAWSFDVPAFSKFPVRDLKAHCTLTGTKRVHVTIYASGEEPTLEFTSADLKNACRSGYLVPPVCTIFVPALESALGYRHFGVANKDEVQQKITAFLTTDHDTKLIAQEVGRHIAHQVEVKGRGKTILSVSIIPPKGVEFAALDTRSNATTTSSRSALPRRHLNVRSAESIEMAHADNRRREQH